MIKRHGDHVIVAREGRATVASSSLFDTILGRWGPGQPDHEWKKALVDACYTAIPDGSETGRITNLRWLDLIELLIEAPGPKALEAIWRLDGDQGLESLADARAKELHDEASAVLYAMGLLKERRDG